MKKILALVLVLAMVVFAFGCAAEPAAEEKVASQIADAVEEVAEEEAALDAVADAIEEAAETYNVCVILPMSGPYANTGNTMWAGIQCAYEYFTTVAGGFQNKNVNFEFTLCDLENDPDLAASLFEKNAASMDAGIGCYKTAATIACAALATKYEIPFLNPMSTADTASALDSKYVFKMCVSDSQSMTSIADCMKFLQGLDDHTYSKGSIIYCSDDYGKSISSALQGLIFPTVGWEVAAMEQLQTNATTDASGAINKAKQSGSDLTCTVLSSAEAVLVQKQFKEYKFDQPVWSGGAGYFDISYFENTAGAGNYVVCACSWEKCEMKTGPKEAYDWYDRISEVAGVTFSEAGATSWLAVAVLCEGVENAASLAGSDVAAAIAKLDLPKDHWGNMFTQYNGIRFGQAKGLVGVETLYGANLGATCIFVQSLNDEWNLVFQPGGEVANNPIVWPHVPYNED